MNGPATILGVDIGATGALALITEAGELAAVEDMPVLRDGPAGRPTINAALLAQIIRHLQPSRAWVEYVGARPGEAPSGAFAFGRSAGTVAGVLGALGVSSHTITPAACKRAVGLPPGREGAKDAARSLALQLWPRHADVFARAKDHGRADAALIARAGLIRERHQ